MPMAVSSRPGLLLGWVTHGQSAVGLLQQQQQQQQQYRSCAQEA